MHDVFEIGEDRSATSFDITDGRAAHTGDENFLTNLEGLLNRVLKPRKSGRKPEKQEK